MNISKNILITGVSTGLGYGATKELIARGYTIFGSVRKEEDADKLQSEFGDRFIPLIFDVTDQAGVLKAVEEVKLKLNGQGLGGLINNSGISVSGPIQYLPIDEFSSWEDGTSLYVALCRYKACGGRDFPLPSQRVDAVWN
jgi:NAD(P)-dependent dehydrogenase (short-subunit alcohol dehydrogenase family)